MRWRNSQIRLALSWTTLAKAMQVLVPAVLRVAVWLAPVMVVVWVVMSAVGRTIVLRLGAAALDRSPPP